VFAEDQDWVEKLRLGGLLAMSVLRFHSTPWLPESWNSHDISFMPSTPGPHATVAEKYPNCNFEVATNLENAELQTAVLVHVVKELDVCL